MTSSHEISQITSRFMPELLEIRQHIHAHPELSGQEYQTAAIVAGELRKFGWQVTEGIGKTGIQADLGAVKKYILALRVDMDALPIEETTGLKFKSLNQGVMHACGHDLHTCIGIGVAKTLSELPQIPIGVRLLFQPAEEIACGARWMIEDGALNGVSSIIGIHAFPELLVNQVGLKSGVLTAAAGELEIEIIGDGGHGARPHETIDSIWVASKVISGLQEAISRQLDSLKPVVISFGKIQGGSAFNVIASKVKLLGTVRYLDTELGEILPRWIEKHITSIAETYRASASVKYKSIAPPVINDHVITKILENSSKKIIGNSNVKILEKPSLGAEDFAEYLNFVPGAMMRLGVAGQTGCAPLHNGNFSPDEDCMEIAINILCDSILNWLDMQDEFGVL